MYKYIIYNNIYNISLDSGRKTNKTRLNENTKNCFRKHV